MMHWWQAMILGAVEGLTEYLPVSSTAHLILAQRALGIAGGEGANAYAICIQAGAILAVLSLYLKRIGSMLNGVAGRDPEGRALAVNVIVGFVPAAIIGKLLDDPIERVLFGLWPVVIAWFVGGLAILVVSYARRGKASSGGKPLSALTPQRAAIIGLAQCLALWPGTSRSLATIVAGLLVGLEMVAAVEFSFLLGLVTLSAATAYKALKSGGVMVHEYGALNIAIGAVVSFLSALAAVRWMVGYLKRHGLWVFGVYRVLLALIVAELLATGMLRP